MALWVGRYMPTCRGRLASSPWHHWAAPVSKGAGKRPSKHERWKVAWVGPQTSNQGFRVLILNKFFQEMKMMDWMSTYANHSITSFASIASFYFRPNGSSLPCVALWSASEVPSMFRVLRLPHCHPYLPQMQFCLVPQLSFVVGCEFCWATAPIPVPMLAHFYGSERSWLMFIGGPCTAWSDNRAERIAFLQKQGTGLLWWYAQSRQSWLFFDTSPPTFFF